jgi:hypothetical protein
MMDSACWKQHLTELKIKWLSKGGKSTVHVFVCRYRAEQRKIVMAAGENTSLHDVSIFLSKYVSKM